MADSVTRRRAPTAPVAESVQSSTNVPGSGQSSTPHTSSRTAAPLKSNPPSTQVTQAPEVTWWTRTKVAILRSLGNFAFWMHRMANPGARVPTRTIWIDSLIAKAEDRGKRKIRIDIYEPEGAQSSALRPALFNFHGGGFVLGSSTDDAPWCSCVADEVGAVIFSVDYRMGPDCFFPTNIEDCVDAILQITAQAQQYRIDPSRVFLSGFSAGGTQALASWVILNSPERFGYTFDASSTSSALRIAGLVLFYPLLDWTVPRETKRANAPDPNRTIPPYLTNLFHAAYVTSLNDKSDLRASPGLMSDEMIKQLPPTHLCICEYDMLRQEAEEFRDRALAAGRQVSRRMVMDEEHGFDKPFPITQKPVVAEEYTEAIGQMRRWASGAQIE